MKVILNVIFLTAPLDKQGDLGRLIPTPGLVYGLGFVLGDLRLCFPSYTDFVSEESTKRFEHWTALKAFGGA